MAAYIRHDLDFQDMERMCLAAMAEDRQSEVAVCVQQMANYNVRMTEIRAAVARRAAELHLAIDKVSPGNSL